MSAAEDYDEAFDAWYDEAVETLEDLANKLVVLRGYRPPDNYPVKQGLAMESLSDIARTQGKRIVSEAVEHRITWTWVGRSLGISRQAAAKRFGL